MILAVLATLSATTVQLESTTIEIAVARDTARVEARYRVAQPVDSLRMIMMRLPDQRVDFGAEVSRVVAIDAAGAYHIRVAYGAPPAGVVVRYEVRGTLDRIPLPIPYEATAPGRSDVRIRIDGVERSIQLHDGFPRLTRGADGVVTAQPENVPSFVRLPSAAGISTNRIADASVIVLLVLATVLWFVQRRTLARVMSASR